MGKYPKDWEKHLAGISKRGYNMIHFTPLQQRGASNSPYSIYDQLAFDPECFPRGEKDVAELVENMEKNYNLLGMTDVVLNHTAHNSRLLQEHPDVGYNISTAPWLTSALELDTALLEFGENLATLGFPTLLKSVDDLLKIMGGIKEHVIAKLKLWEFYVINVEENADAIVTAWANGNITFPDGGFGGSGIGGLESIKTAIPADQAKFIAEKGMIGTDKLGCRYRRRVDPTIGAALLTAIFGRFEGEDANSSDKAAARSRLVHILDELNLPFYKEYDGDIAEVLEQICKS